MISDSFSVSQSCTSYPTVKCFTRRVTCALAFTLCLMVLTLVGSSLIGKIEVYALNDESEPKMLRTIDGGAIFGKKDNTTNER